MICLKVPDEKIISALFSCKTNAEAAKMAGLSESQFYKRIGTKEFREKYERTLDGVLERATDAAALQLADSIKTLKAVRDSKDCQPQTRVYAADTLLRHSLKIVERSDRNREKGNIGTQIEDNLMDVLGKTAAADWSDYESDFEDERKED